MYIAFALRLSDPFPMEWIQQAQTMFLGLLVLAVPTFLFFGTHRIQLSSIGFYAFGLVLQSAAVLTILGLTINFFIGFGAPRSAPLIFGLVFFLLALSGRVLLRGLWTKWNLRADDQIPVAIYGAGEAGAQLMSALQTTKTFRPVALVDDSIPLQGVIVGDLKVKSPDLLEKMIQQGQIERVFLAMPSLDLAQRRRVLNRLSSLDCEVQQIPSYVDLINETDIVSSLRPVTEDELLGRDKVDLDIPEIAKAYAGRSIMVTGAGGSIGSELCRQLLACKPRRIILFEMSEFALYSLERELAPLVEQRKIELVPCLGTVMDRTRLDRLLTDNEVEIILHAAAYKHVPLVEANGTEGVKNNIFGTHTLAEAARAANIERFILISTDKAVRPTNIMGATKRLAELVVQDIQTRSDTTKFAMVRFGNVLGSSGSVIPLFREQIAAGGPVTLTDPDVTRYFMTIPEASRLVLLAGAYATGGDVFVLDMGEPVVIGDLARRMIELSGRSVKDDANPDGDIEIEIVGLRPGEKLYEELLIDNNMLTTPHEKILRASEESLTEIQVAATLRKLSKAIEENDIEAIRAVFEERVSGYSFMPRSNAIAGE